MATLQFTSFWSANETGKGPVLNENVVTIAGTSAQSGVMDPNGGNKPRSVRVAVDAKCWVTWGADPTALNDGTDGRMMGSDVSTVEYFDIPADHKIAVIERT